MKKFVVAAAALFTLAFAAPAFAQDMACDQAAMDKMKAEMEKVSDATKKDAAMKEMEMAMTAMKDSKADECKMHMDGAMKAMQ
jgi:hypothetical protein